MAKICKVLLVENDADIRQLLDSVFADQGYRFVTASSGPEMRRALAADRDIDIVIIDVILPGGDSGFALAETAADQGHGVILVTGDHQRFDELEKSGHRYLLKPFGLGSLLALVEQVLAASKRHCIRERPASIAGPATL